MTVRINSPYPQPGPVGLAVVGVIGVWLLVQRLVEAGVGTDPWWAAVLGLTINFAGLAFIEGGWLWVQREVAVSEGAITIRRWVEILVGRPGRSVPRGPETHAAIVVDHGRRQLRISRGDTVAADLTILYWAPSDIRAMLDAFRTAGIPLTRPWQGEYPPWA